MIVALERKQRELAALEKQLRAADGNMSAPRTPIPADVRADAEATVDSDSGGRTTVNDRCSSDAPVDGATMLSRLQARATADGALAELQAVTRLRRVGDADAPVPADGSTGASERDLLGSRKVMLTLTIKPDQPRQLEPS